MQIAFFCKDDFNLGAGYVIAYLKSIGHGVRLFLEFRGSPSPRTLLSLKEQSPDLVCISCVTANYGWALQTAKDVRSVLPRARILFGGVHPTLCPEQVKAEGWEVCEGDGLAYFGGKFDPDNQWAEREMFFNQLPPVHRRYQIFMTGFGCPFRCSFCNNHQLHRELTRRSVEGCIAELHHLKERGMRYVLFDDDIFTLNRSWLIRFLHSYHHCISLPFTCFGHAKCFDEYTAKALKESGCQTVWLGLQSGVEDVRKTILNRFETNRDVEKVCKIIKENGLKLMIDHIFGLPFDNYDKLLESYEFYKTLKPDVVNVYELLYFPKAEINKYGSSKALYQRQGGQDYKKYARAFASLPLVCY